MCVWLSYLELTTVEHQKQFVIAQHKDDVKSLKMELKEFGSIDQYELLNKVTGTRNWAYLVYWIFVTYSESVLKKHCLYIGHKSSVTSTEQATLLMTKKAYKQIVQLKKAAVYIL